MMMMMMVTVVTDGAELYDYCCECAIVDAVVVTPLFGRAMWGGVTPEVRRVWLCYTAYLSRRDDISRHDDTSRRENISRRANEEWTR